MIDAGAELGVVVAYGRLIKPHVLDAVPMVNLHFSLLPRWRGAAPVERAILAGDTVTGVCVMALEEGLDTGPVYASVEDGHRPRRHPRRPAPALSAEAGTALLVRLLDDGLPEPAPQVGEATYAGKMEPDDHRLDWSQPAEPPPPGRAPGPGLDDLPGPPAAHPLGPPGRRRRAGDLAEGEIDPSTLEVGTGGGGALALVEVQPEGKAPQPAAAWRNGARLRPATAWEPDERGSVTSRGPRRASRR